MKEVTLLVPDHRVPEFYRRFGEFMSIEEVHTGGAKQAYIDDGYRWVHAPGASALVSKLWAALSPAGQSIIGYLADCALESLGSKCTPKDLVDTLGQENGVSGIAGIFGSVGRAATKVGVPRTRTPKGVDWHYIWDWDGAHYWMEPEVARLIQAAQRR